MGMRVAQRALTKSVTVVVSGLVFAACDEKVREAAPLQPDAPVTPALTFADPRLKGAVRQALDQLAGPIAGDSAAVLERLGAAGQQISDLSGIEGLTGLTTLDLAGNAIADIGPLASLRQLAFLDLSGNQVHDLSPLEHLAHLGALFLSGNRVNDLSVLMGLAELTSVDLTGNPLDRESSSTHLDSLRRRGVQVTYGDTGRQEAPPEPASFLDLGLRVAFIGESRNALEDLYLVDLDGHSEPVNASQWPGRYGDLSIDAGGRRLAYIADGMAEWRDNWYLWVLDLETLQTSRVLEDAFGPSSYAEPTWSPDGSRLVLVRQHRLYSDLHLVDVGTGTVTDLTGLAQSGTHCWQPDWSPDGGRVAFTLSQDMFSDLCVIDAAGGDIQHLSSEGVSAGPHWSPDGTLLLYTKVNPGGSDLWVMSPDGSGDQILAAGPGQEYFPSWSPDGSGVAYLSVNDGRPELVVVSHIGEASVRINWPTDASGVPLIAWTRGVGTRPMWTPDSRHVAFAAVETHGTGCLFLVEADGGEPVNLTRELDLGEVDHFLLVAPQP